MEDFVGGNCFNKARSVLLNVSSSFFVVEQWLDSSLGRESHVPLSTTYMNCSHDVILVIRCSYPSVRTKEMGTL